MKKNQMRVAVVDGVRTPFVKAGSYFVETSFQELGSHVLCELMRRNPGCNLDEIWFGNVLLDPRTPNWAREICYAAKVDKSVYAQSVSNNCISGLVSITGLAERIAGERISVAIAGGSESMSNPTLVYRKEVARSFLRLGRARKLGNKLKNLCFVLSHVGGFFPPVPSVTEPSTGLTMGEHMEITAKKMSIGREIQDKIAFQSHMKAHNAAKSGVLGQDIVPFNGIEKDRLIRSETSVDKLSSLKPVFDRSEKGTITAGNSSALTDGAAAVLLMSEKEVQKCKVEPLAFINDYEYSAIDANEGLLMAPGVCVPRLLKRNDLRLEDFDLIEIHEAFGAQVAANIQAWEQGWKEDAIGTVDMQRLNVNGGSIAIGHPFAATGGRIITTTARELKRRGKGRALISICAAGAMAGAMILEAP